ncbi:MAG: metallophosphoesterase [Candidatus Peribacteria bacterium]|nr:metallophosphoesterase [Candidatus Peribacteria bacterium]
MVVGSFILAGIGTLMDFCYLAKNRILHGIGSVFLRLLVLLSISTATLILEQVLHPNIRIPGTAIILFIFAVTIGGFIRDKRLISTHLILKNAKLKTDHTVVFVSDLHADLIHSQRYLRKLVNKILMEQPDLVLIGGDLINIPHERYISYFEEFQRIKVPVYAVIGNHDIYFGPDTTIIEKIFKV